jgi:plasmid replication initiation protein
VKEAGISWEINWLSAIAYPDNMGYVEIEFNHKLMPFLCDLETKFTRYKLNQTCALKSIYSWRVLELFEQMLPTPKKSGWLVINLEDFHHAMEATTTHRKNFNQTRTKIIEPAVNELIKKDNWIIEWEPIKEGRKVASLYFNFKKK